MTWRSTFTGIIRRAANAHPESRATACNKELHSQDVSTDGSCCSAGHLRLLLHKTMSTWSCLYMQQVRRESRLPSDARRVSQNAYAGAALSRRRTSIWMRRPSIFSGHHSEYDPPGPPRVLKENTYQLEPTNKQRFKASHVKAIVTSILQVGVNRRCWRWVGREVTTVRHDASLKTIQVCETLAVNMQTARSLLNSRGADFISRQGDHVLSRIPNFYHAPLTARGISWLPEGLEAADGRPSHF